MILAGVSTAVPRRSWWACLMCACLFASSLGATQDDERLAALFEQLGSATDANAAQSIENRIWRSWLDSGDTRVDSIMAEGIAAMGAQRLGAALASFDRVVEAAPGFAEGWNKRATVYWLLDRLPESMADIRRTLTLEPRHFGALSGMGQIFLQSGDEEGALRAFEAVLKISPQSPGARHNVEVLRERLRDRQV